MNDEREAVVLSSGARDFATPEWSTAVVLGTNLAVPLAAIALLAVSTGRLLRQARLARASQQRAKEASEDPVAGEAVIHGTVSSVEHEGAAVRLTITQHGVSVKPKKGSWTTTWTETERTLESQPFYLKTDAGLEIRVEPGRQVRLVDDLHTRPVRDGRFRDRVAELTVGEEVYASGVLAPATERRASGGYRDEKPRLELRPRSAGAAVHISTKPLTERYTQAAAARILWMVLLAVTTLAVQALAAPYHLARVFGVDETARVASQRQKHSDEEHYHNVTVVLDSGDEEEFAIETHEDYDRLSAGTVVHAHVTRVGGWTRMTLDRGARAYKNTTYIPLVAIVLMLLLCAIVLRRERDWYDREVLIDKEPGRLQTPDG